MVMGSGVLKLNLTQQQIDAVQCRLGPAIVLAEVGSGATIVLAHRFIYLVEQMGFDPSRILCLTDTNREVSNLKCQIVKYSSDQLATSSQDNFRIITFHALGRDIIQDVRSRETKEQPEIIDAAKCMSLVREIIGDFKHIKLSLIATNILFHLRWICKLNGREFTLEDLEESARKVTTSGGGRWSRGPVYEEMKDLYVKFEEALKRNNFVTLDDLLLDSREMLNDANLSKEWSSRFDAILCDNFQFVDEVRFDILTNLLKGHNNIFCVGNPGYADCGRENYVNPFTKLNNHFNKLAIYTQIKKLDKNFRSTAQIHSVINSLLASGHPDETLLNPRASDDNPEGPVPEIYISNSSDDQARKVLGKIKDLQKQGVPLSNIAVLANSPNHYLSIKRAMAHQDIEKNKDAEMIAEFLKRAEIKLLIWWLGVAFVDCTSKKWGHFLKNVYCKPPCGVSISTFMKLWAHGAEKVMDTMKELSRENPKLLDLLNRVNSLRSVADNTDLTFRDKCAEIAKLSGLLDYYSRLPNRISSINDFLNCQLLSNAPSFDDIMRHTEHYLLGDEFKGISFATIKKSMGFEFDHVLLVSLSEDHFPDAKDKNEETIRLMYVACSRARKTLTFFTDSPRVVPCIKKIESQLKEVTGEVA